MTARPELEDFEDCRDWLAAMEEWRVPPPELSDFDSYHDFVEELRDWNAHYAPTQFEAELRYTYREGGPLT